MNVSLDIILIAIVLVSACIIPGTFLVLRRLSLLSDAISHSALLGIVIAFFIVGRLDSFWLVLGASVVGMVTVFLIELLISTKRVKEDAAIGLVFPVFFSIGVILINKFAGNIHFDSDCILFGEIAFAPFERMIVFNTDLGPKALWVMGSILLMNITFLIVFYKELKLVTFDEGLAELLGFKPKLFHYLLMLITAITVVGAFESVGSILVVALMIVPVATSMLISTRVLTLILFALGVGIVSVLVGYGVSFRFDTSISGTIVSVLGVCFFVMFLFGYPNGLVFKVINFKKQQLQFSSTMFLVQLFNHEDQQKEQFEMTALNMVEHMDWTEAFSQRVTTYCIKMKYILQKGHQYRLTNLGREKAKEAITMA